MPDDTLRGALRARTAPAHEQLDHAVGHFSDLATYGHFARNTYRFRHAVEAAMLAAEPVWPIDPVAQLAAEDLADLRLSRPPTTPFPLPLTSEAAQLGVAYVLEGSGLGARLLVREAGKLGLTSAFGARHLARQAADHDRWRRFVALLDSTSAATDAVIAAAEATFRFALSIYAEPAHERA